MADPKGFLKAKRRVAVCRPIGERVKDFQEVACLPEIGHSKEQASRCMDCGTPFCHWGCPVGNYIPEWNDFMFQGQWKKAFELLDATNNLPEITGRICPAPCEYSCVLGINDDAVTIRENELAIIEQAFEAGLVVPRIPKKRTGKRVAVVGSGPAGLCCAIQLNQAGHEVVVFEKDDKIGGILRYGIPDFKLEKHILDRRIEIWKKEGVKFKTGIEIGEKYPAAKLKKEFDALCLAGGCRVPRDFSPKANLPQAENIEGRNLTGIHFAMDYLVQSNRRNAGEKIASSGLIDAKGKKVVVIGGGDTGSDCVGTAHRQGAKSVVQIELLEQPLECRSEDFPWPKYPMILKTSTSHEEGGLRQWAVLTKKFIGEQSKVKKLSCIKVEFIEEERNSTKPEGRSRACPVMREIAGSEFEIEADLVILALGFLHPEQNGLLGELGLELDQRKNVKTNQNYMTSVNGVFSCGDMRRGQSLIVWAISEGRKCAYAIDEWLMGSSSLPLI